MRTASSGRLFAFSVRARNVSASGHCGVMVTNWLLKVLWEALLTPVTYAVVGALKRAEGVDVYDRGTNFSPFHMRV